MVCKPFGTVRMPDRPSLPDPPSLDEQLCFAVYAATLAINRAYKPLLDRLGLTYPQFLVLQAAHEADGRTVGAIASRLALEPSTVTPMVKRLAAAGLLARCRNPDDEREVRVHLTDAGHAVWAETGCLANTMLDRSGMTPAQLAALNAQVRALSDALLASVPGKH